MSRAALKPALRLLSILGAVVLLSAAATDVAAAASTRYASPAGGGDCSSPAAACDLKTAIQSAIPGDTVVVGTGMYVSSQTITSGGRIDIHGDTTQPRPVISSSAPIALDVEDQDSTLSYLDVSTSAANGRAVKFNGTLAESLIARASGAGADAFELENESTLRDSLVVGAFDGVLIDGAGSAKVRNVTAIGGTGWAIDAQSSGTGVTPTITNTIARNTGNPYGIWGNAPSGNVKVTVSYSNYDQGFVTSGSSTIVDGGHNQHSAPVFVNAAAFDYHEAAGSPTIDAGLTDPADAGTLDLDRQARTQGAGTDIGADEAVSTGTPAPGPGGGSSDKTAPVVTKAALVPTHFAVKRHGHRPKPNVHYGTSIRFSLSETAHVRGTVTMRAAGRLVGKSCRKPAPSNRGRRACVRWVAVGSFAKSAKRGRTKIAFSGKLGGYTLEVGSYRLALVATDAAKNRSHTKTLGFRIVRG
jgi:hypothetical protein